MAEKEEKKTTNSVIPSKDGNAKEPLPPKKTKSKTSSLPPITKEWTKEAVQYGLKEWFHFFPTQSTPDLEKKLSAERKKEAEHLNQLCDWNMFILSHLRSSTIAEFNTFLDWLFELYTEPYKRDVKNYLVTGGLRKLISTAFAQDPNATYPLLEKINKTVPVCEYPFITFDPHHALYGSTIQKTGEDAKRLTPLSDQDIVARLDLFAKNKNSIVFTKWVLAILQYNPLTVPSVSDFHESRASAKKWICDQLLGNNEIRDLMLLGLKDNDQLQMLLSVFQKQQSMISSVSSLQKEIEQINGQYQTQKTEIDSLKKQLETKDRAIEQYKELQRKTEYEKIVFNEKSKQSEQRLNLQILANERLVAENERRLQKATADAAQATSRVEQLENENQKLSQELENVQADLDLSQNSLKNAEQAVGEQEDRTKKILLRNLAEGLAEPLYYLNGTSQYLEQKHPEDSAIMELPEFLSQINKTLSSMGLTKFGREGESVSYDSALHELEDGICSKGDTVKVLQCGWKINGDVYKKASVQKGE